MNRIRPFLFVMGALLAAFPLIAIDSSPVFAQDSSLYQLTEESQYIEGCFEPCMCPVFMTPSLSGSFLLNPLTQEMDGSLFEVIAIDWEFILWDETMTVTGSGIFEVGSGQQQLILDLQVGDGPVQQFDSGLVTLQGEFPDISIDVALNGFYCYDYVFSISATQETVELSSSRWGTLKSYYR